MTPFLVGIDLGTTNSALAYVDLRKAGKGPGSVQSFAITQLVGAGEIGTRDLLPSFWYLPGTHDLPAGAAALPWDTSPRGIVGEFARNHGARVPGRLVTSAKSWLCHAGVDRSAPLLPWSAPPDVPRVSPVEASARYLQHLVESWNFTMARNTPAHRLEKQEVVLTVPASFDDMARTLTVEAAKKAGLEKITLLEEPQAAFYCWLATISRETRNSQESRVESREQRPEQRPELRAESREQSKGRDLALDSRLSSLVSPSTLDSLKPGDCCLVVDLGGGTTDFSLIQAVEHEGRLEFIRQAVGDHLLLGGDNMDLALAKFVETRLPFAAPYPQMEEGSTKIPSRLDAAQYGLLTQACRQAKETLLGPNPPESHTVTVVGRGRQVIGGARHARLTPEDVRRVILEGFFPVVPADAEPQRGARVGLHEMGLPYVSDPAITRHLAGFLKRQALLAQEPSQQTQLPRAVLFNGGVFTPAILRDRLIEVLRHWFNRADHPWHPLVLTTPSLDLAVACGAAHFAWLKHTGQRRIGGGLARSYYLGIQRSDEGPESDEGRVTSDKQKIDSIPPLVTGHSSLVTKTVLCVVPQHLEEGQEISLPRPELELTLGQPVMFPLYTSTVRGGDRPGDILQVAGDQLLQLSPLHTLLRGGKRSGTKNVPVTLAARCTEIGTLELWCVAREGGNRWRLEFNVRDTVQEPQDESLPGQRTDEPLLTDVWPEGPVQEAGNLIREVFRSQEPGAQSTQHSELSTQYSVLTPQNLTKALETALEAGRDKWPTGLCRRLWDFLVEVADQRRISPAHLGRWYNLVGFCLRPGFGDPLDKFRVEQLWKLLHAPRPTTKGKASLGPPEGGADYWIMWRRVAGGLNVQLQNTLYNRLRAVLLPAKGKSVAKPGANEWTEMWRAAASLERLDVKQKEQLGQAVLKMCRRSPVPIQGFFSLTRLGARVLFYGPLNAVLHPEVVQTWLDGILAFEPGHESERLAWAFCLTQLARKSGQRALDVDESHRRSVLTVLRSQTVPAHWIRMVEEVTALETEEQSQLFGESLPIGLRLVQSDE